MRDESTLVVHGNLEELIQELSRLAEGWEHFGKGYLRDQCFTAIEEMRSGQDRVTVGHTQYQVE